MTPAISIRIRVPREWEKYHRVLVRDQGRTSLRPSRVLHTRACLFYCEEHNVSGGGLVMMRHNQEEHTN